MNVAKFLAGLPAEVVWNIQQWLTCPKCNHLCATYCHLCLDFTCEVCDYKADRHFCEKCSGHFPIRNNRGGFETKGLTPLRYPYFVTSGEEGHRFYIMFVGYMHEMGPSRANLIAAREVSYAYLKMQIPRLVFQRDCLPRVFLRPRIYPVAFKEIRRKEYIPRRPRISLPRKDSIPAILDQ